MNNGGWLNDMPTPDLLMLFGGIIVVWILFIPVFQGLLLRFFHKYDERISLLIYGGFWPFLPLFASWYLFVKFLGLFRFILPGMIKLREFIAGAERKPNIPKAHVVQDQSDRFW